jgi:hypothetical protein
MTDIIERGIIIDGIVLPGTERVIRDSSAWWTAGRETRPRRYPIELLVGHWTAGHTREGPTAGPRLWRAMESRRAADGGDLSVSVHFSVAWDGLIWQHLDLAHAAVHVGHRPTITRSIGVECMWPGTARQAARLGAHGQTVVRRVDGQRIECMRPSDELLESWRWLAETLAAARDSRIAIPRRVAPPDRRLTLAQLAQMRGCIEHMHLPDTRKIDACGLLTESLGWPSV